MATPKEARTETNQTISINNCKASPRNKGIGNQDTVTFQNNDQNNDATVTFLGAGADEFGSNPINVPAGNSSSVLTPTTPNITVNYQVTQAGAMDEPFSIEVGTGPLEIDISGSNGDPTPANAGIANGGTLFFENESTTQQASITFGGDHKVLFYPDGSPVTSPLVVPASSSSPILQGRGASKHVTYDTQLQVAKTGREFTTGSGSIKVGQT
jgi:hypothetical protein